MRICRVATVPFFLQHHLREQILATVNAGHQVTLIAGDGPEIPDLKKIPGVDFVLIDIARTISPLRDVRALWKLIWHFRRARYDVVHSTTPKAGMLCAVAGFLVRVPVRLHTFTGQPWMELSGPLRFLAKAGDWLTAHLNTMSYADSDSQKNFLIGQGVSLAQKIAVIGKGSLAGVNLERFDRQRCQSLPLESRQQLGIPENALVITFIGRLTRDKGVAELVEAFVRLESGERGAILLLVGPQEPERDPLPDETLKVIHNNPCIISTGYSDEPEKYLALTDVFCLPSYREGFGNVVIEAAAMGVPTVGTEIVGLKDAVVDGETGLLVAPKDVIALVDGLRTLIEDAEMRSEMGRKARERAIRDFDARKINADVLKEYSRLRKTDPCQVSA